MSRRLLDAETRYSPVERLCLCLYFSCTKLRHYLLSAECVVVSKGDAIRYVLSLPILNWRIGKWILALSEFDLRYELAKAVKGQVMADFVTQHCGPELNMVCRYPVAGIPTSTAARQDSHSHPRLRHKGRSCRAPRVRLLPHRANGPGPTPSSGMGQVTLRVPEEGKF
jgi:hypothetical protein